MTAGARSRRAAPLCTRAAANRSSRSVLVANSEALQVAGGTLGGVNQTDRAALEEALDQLSPEDRVWLEERLEEYREALQYLHDH